MNRERLTDERIRRFACPPDSKQAFLWDTVAPRLAVRATAGAKSFVFESKLNRQTIRRTIGDVRVWLIEDARAEANRLQTMVDQGVDPREADKEKAAAKEAAKAVREAARKANEERQRYTLRALCEAYVAHLKAQGKTKTATDVRSAFKVHALDPHPDIANTPACDVTAHQVAAMVRKVREAGKERTAGILRNYLVAAYNAARRAPFDSGVSSGLIEFAITTNPAEVVPAIPVRRGDRTLSAAELKAYMEALGDDEAGNTLRLALMAGGQRMAQLVRAMVSDYNRETATLRLWDGKGKRAAAREHLLPLAPKAAALIERLLELRKQPDAPIFGVSERAAGDKVAEVSAAMGGESFDLRDIRRTCETMLAGMGISRETRAQLLSHGISGVQAAHYDRHSYIDEKRAALTAWELKLEEIQTGEKVPANVHRLRRRGKTAA